MRPALPLADGEIDPVRTVGSCAVQERHTLSLEAPSLLAGATERESGRETAVGEHHAVAGNLPLIRVAVQGESDEPRHARRSDEPCDLAVGRHLPPWNLTDDGIDPLIE